jgi:hypothetical protein
MDKTVFLPCNEKKLKGGKNGKVGQGVVGNAI